VQAGTRPTADQLAALAEGDPVTVESGAEFSRTRHTTGTVVRVGDSQILVKLPGPRGVTYVERYGRRDGWRIGRGNRAALVSLEAADPATSDDGSRSASTSCGAPGRGIGAMLWRCVNCTPPSGSGSRDRGPLLESLWQQPGTVGDRHTADLSGFPDREFLHALPHGRGDPSPRSFCEQCTAERVRGDHGYCTSR
jgi:hypothetical protein